MKDLRQISLRAVTVLLIALPFICTSMTAKAEERPNIIYIICDDLGYGDVQYLNPKHGKILTPEIDKLASEAMTFTDAHSGSSVCTPTRYGVLTGRYAWRTHLQSGVLRAGNEFKPLISEEQLTVPMLLKERGYTTAAIGKWHLGFAITDSDGKELDLYNGKKAPTAAPIGSIVPDGPITRGFDSYIGFHHAASMETVIENGVVIDQMPTVKMLPFLGKHAKRYIKKRSKESEPFFLYLALNSPHTPIVPSKKWKGKSGMGDYCDFVMETDDVVGQVIDAVEKCGISENTIIFFTSDNGCSYPSARGKNLEKKYGHYSSAQYRGSKSDIWEGGHRVPFMVKWAGNIEAESQSSELICLTNLLATCADITGADLPKDSGEDSYSILPILKDSKAESPYKSVIHHSIDGKFSIRKGKWKLELCSGSGGWSGPKDKQATAKGLPEAQLYNLEIDESEKNNVYTKYPEIAKELTSELVAIVEKGRTTQGAAEDNDVKVDIFKKK